MNRLDEDILKVLNETTLHDIAMSYGGRASHDPGRAQHYLDFHYEFPYGTELVKIDADDVNSKGSYYITDGYKGLMFIKGKNVSKTNTTLTDAIKLENAKIYEIPKDSISVKRNLTDKDKLAAKLGFDWFNMSWWEEPEYKAKQNFMKYFNIEDTEYQIKAIHKTCRPGRVYWDRFEHVFWIEFQNWSCTLPYFMANIKPATDKDRAWNTYIADQD